MSILSADFSEKTTLDFALIALAGSVLVGFMVVGAYGANVGFVQTTSYFKANDIVSFACALIAAGCGLFLILEYADGPLQGRMVLGACVICGTAGFFAASMGVPASIALTSGKPGAVYFSVDRTEYGGRNCSSVYVATHPDYTDLRLCYRASSGPRPRVGGKIEVKGHITKMGITREQTIVRN